MQISLLIQTIAFVSMASAEPSASSLERELDLRLDRMEGAQGEEYLEQREALRALGKGAIPAISARMFKARSSQDALRRSLVVEITHAWLARPEDCGRLYALSGLRPDHYLKRRRPEPEVSAEIRRLVGHVPPAIFFELALKTSNAYPWSPRSLYPSAVDEPTFASLRKKELRALREGVIAWLGRLDHSAAPLLLEEMIQSDERSLSERKLALLALADTGSARAFEYLSYLAAGGGARPEELRIAALIGLGKFRTEESLEILLGQAGGDGSIQLRTAAIRATGSLASAWALASKSGLGTHRLGARAADRLRQMLVAPSGGEYEAALIDALQMTEDDEATKKLAAFSDDLSHDAASRTRARRAASRLARQTSQAVR